LQTVPARGQIDDSFSVAPGSFITSISGFCDQPEGFVMQITDKGSGRTLADAPARYLCLTGGSGSKYPGRPLPFVLTDPFVITAPGLLMVKIVSLSVNPQNINVFLSVAERS
jgi:hypothetical protein